MRKIGVLDSGIGGLTTCNYILKHNPHINIFYYADNKNAPYGLKNKNFVKECVLDGIRYLLGLNVEAIVIACNTATSVAIKEIRSIVNIPIIGTEPEINKCDKSTILLTTPLTQKMRNYDMQIADTTYLADLIERCCMDQKMLSYLASKFIGYSSIVLGCTHYIFLKKYLDEPLIFDGGDGVARRTNSLICEQISNKSGKIFLHFSGKSEFSKYIKAFSILG